MQGGDLKARRKAMGMTQGELAAALGLTPTFIGMMERDEKPIEPRTAYAVQHVSVLMRSNTVAGYAQKCRRAARGEYRFDHDEFDQMADWLDMIGHLPRDD